jgi:glycogen phosphorylase
VGQELLGGELLVAYFCTEFGVDPRLPIYSGGLGVLAGDHLKSSSDLGLPLVGVGLFYRGGYFRQGVDAKGRQLETYPPNDPTDLPLEPTPVEIGVNLDGEDVRARVWKAQVGQVPLYLLDTDVDGNSTVGRAVTSTLYGGDREQRLRQELMLGVGGVRALHALGVEPTVFHMNEGHAALLTLERLRVLVEAGASFEEALELVRASTVFTTHTPVAAGHDVFESQLARRYLGGFADELGISWSDLAALARVGDDDEFGMTPLALRTAEFVNAVSYIHGGVSRHMWHPLWPDRPEDDVPITHVTNGVHAGTWLAPELGSRLGGDWSAARALDPAEVWGIHRARKDALLELVTESTGVTLDPDALTIGFARRFATYKRADLLFSDEARIARLLSNPDRPVQILLAGKAHPRDEAGKDVLQHVFAFAEQSGGRAVFLEGYDLALAAMLVQGCDVWLNTPLRPLEASGTSGMKAGMNGVLNVSILDGWWYEGYSPALGWAIGGAENDGAENDGALLYSVLEDEVVPRFYDRGEDGIPHAWVEMMKASIAEIGERFNSGRMVGEYVEKLYVPASRRAAAALSGASVLT